MRRVSLLMTLTALVSALFVLVPGAVAQTGGFAIGNVHGEVEVAKPQEEGTDPLAPCEINPDDEGYEFLDVFIEGAFEDPLGNQFAGLINVDSVAGKAVVCNPPIAGADFETDENGLPTGAFDYFVDENGEVSGDKGHVNGWHLEGVHGVHPEDEAWGTRTKFEPATFTGNGMGIVAGIFFGTYVRYASFVEVTLDTYYKIGTLDVLECQTDTDGDGNEDVPNVYDAATNPGGCHHSTVYVRAQFTPVMETDRTYRKAIFDGEFGTP